MLLEKEVYHLWSQIVTIRASGFGNNVQVEHSLCQLLKFLNLTNNQTSNIEKYRIMYYFIDKKFYHPKFDSLRFHRSSEICHWANMLICVYMSAYMSKHVGYPTDSFSRRPKYSSPHLIFCNLKYISLKILLTFFPFQLFGLKIKSNVNNIRCKLFNKL